MQSLPGCDPEISGLLQTADEEVRDDFPQIIVGQVPCLVFEADDSHRRQALRGRERRLFQKECPEKNGGNTNGKDGQRGDKEFSQTEVNGDFSGGERLLFWSYFYPGRESLLYGQEIR